MPKTSAKQVYGGLSSQQKSLRNYNNYMSNNFIDESSQESVQFAS